MKKDLKSKSKSYFQNLIKINFTQKIKIEKSHSVNFAFHSTKSWIHFGSKNDANLKIQNQDLMVLSGTYSTNSRLNSFLAGSVEKFCFYLLTGIIHYNLACSFMKNF